MDYLTAALILFAIGVLVLLAEVLLPTGGLLVVASLLFFALGVVIILTRGTAAEAVVAIGALAVGLPAAGFVAVAAWRRMSLESVLTDAPTGPVPIPGQVELEALKNRTGKTVSPMRPSGTVEFDGRRVDALTEGVMLDAGVWVRCVAVKGGKVIVRQLEGTPDVSDVAPGLSTAGAVPNIDLGPASVPGRPEPRDEPRSERSDVGASPPPPRRPADDFDDLDLGLDK